VPTSGPIALPAPVDVGPSLGLAEFAVLSMAGFALVALAGSVGVLAVWWLWTSLRGR